MKDPAFLFYSDNFLSGTMFFTDEQVGKYIRLLCAQHLTGHLKENHMIFICKTFDKDIFDKFQKDENGLYFNERLEFEINKRKSYSISRSENKKGKTKQKDIKNISESYDSHMGNENGNENINIDFDVFWNLYDKKVGEKSKLKKKWEKLKDSDRELIITHVSKYKQAQPDKSYRKNPETYLNNKSWNDEIIVKENETNRTSNKRGFNSPETSAAIAATERIFSEYGQGNAFTHPDRD